MRRLLRAGGLELRPAVREAPRRVRGRAWALVLATAVLAAGGGTSGCTAPPPPERIVLVTVDTLRADRVGCYGYAGAHTPTLDALAARGVRFEQAFSPTPLTLPSHTTLMTGVDPPRHGVRHNSIFALGPEWPTLAERMRAAGYATAAFVGAFVLDGQFGLERGFDHYDDRFGDRRSAQVGYAERRADAVVDAALAWAETAPPRFLMWVHVYDPHASYDPPPGFALAFAGRPYDGEIAFVDAQLGRLLDGLAERFGSEGTSVFVTSDHGEALGDHGEPSHSYGIYDATQRIPMIASGTGWPDDGRVSDSLAVLADVAPTLLALADAEPLPSSDGRDLRADLARPVETTAYLETLATHLDLGWSALFGARTSRWKYIEAPRSELYDLDEDPGETRNVIEAHPDVAAELRGWLAPRREAGGSLVASRVSDADRARLEALGYVVPAPAVVSDSDLSGPDPKDEIELLQVLLRAHHLAEGGRPGAAFELLSTYTRPSAHVSAIRSAYALMAGRPAEAEREARAALALHPDRPDYLLLRAGALEAAGRREEADRVFARAAELDPSSGLALLGRGRLREAAGEPEAARTYYDAALALQPESAEARWRRAALHFEGGELEAGRALLEGVGRPPDAAVMLRVAHAEARAGHPAEAAARLSHSLPGLRLSADAKRVAAALLERGGLPEAALPLWEALLEEQPDAWETQNGVAWTLAALGRDLDRALALAERARTGSDGEPRVLDTLAAVHLARGEAERTLDLSAQALQRADSPELRAHLSYLQARAHADLGDHAAAAAALRRALAGADGLTDPWLAGARALQRELGERSGG